jgi:hypothetical protein
MTSDERIRMRLRVHKRMMDENIVIGCTVESASDRAFKYVKDLTDKQLVLKYEELEFADGVARIEKAMKKLAESGR